MRLGGTFHDVRFDAGVSCDAALVHYQPVCWKSCLSVNAPAALKKPDSGVRFRQLPYDPQRIVLV